MNHCRQCLMPENFPNLRMDHEGICHLCRKHSDRPAGFEKDLLLYDELIETSRKGGRKYDCIVCYSGGKDSTYTLIQVVEKGLRPLAFTFDNGFLAEQAKRNIAGVISALGVDHLLFTPNLKQLYEIFHVVLTRRLFDASVTARLSPVCYVCITYINWMALELAMEKNCSMVVSGFTHGQVPKAVFPNNPDLLGQTFQKMKTLIADHVGFDPDLFYPVIDRETFAQKTIYNINPLLFEEYNPERILAKIAEVHWDKPPDTDACSSNCLLNRVGNYCHYRLYGFHPYQYEISSQIRKGSLTLEEGRRMIEDISLDPAARRILSTLKVDG